MGPKPARLVGTGVTLLALLLLPPSPSQAGTQLGATASAGVGITVPTGQLTNGCASLTPTPGEGGRAGPFSSSAILVLSILGGVAGVVLVATVAIVRRRR